jgi:membrane fusion protein, multidrug efflux system
MRFLKIVLLSAAALAATAALVLFLFPQLQPGAGFQPANAAQQGDPSAGVPPFAMPVPVTLPVKRAIPVYIDYVGATEAIRSVTLQAKVTGYLAQRFASDGADVQPNDLLYKIDDRDYRAARDQIAAQLQRDVAALDYAKTSQSRSATLSKKGVVTKDTDEEKTSLMLQAEATLAAEKAALRNAELTLGYTEIRAPFAGRLGRSLVHEGSLIKAEQTELTNLVQLDPIYAAFNPSETELLQIAKYRAKGDLAVDILLSNETEPRFRGKLTFLDNEVDRGTGTITARATIANDAQELLPGQYVRLRLHLTERPDALLVPQAAIGAGQMGKFVYVLTKDNLAEQRFVTLGGVFGDLVVIESGIAETDRIITGNLQKIGPGTPVEAMK